MSEIADETDELFMAGSHSDDALGYPVDVAFVPSDEDWADEVLWRNLIEGQATVLIGEDTELRPAAPRRDRPPQGPCVRQRCAANAWARLVLRDVEPSEA